MEYFDPSAKATNDWDTAMRLAVRAAQYTECARPKGTDGIDAECAAQFPLHFGQQDLNEALKELISEVNLCLKDAGWPLDDAGKASCKSLAEGLVASRALDEGEALVSLAMMNPVVVLCHSPVEANDHPYCGDARLPAGVSSFDCQYSVPGDDLFDKCEAAGSVRMGDLRYHQVNVMKTPQTPSPWGIMTDAIDPITGESVSASINVWGHVNDLWSQKIVDVLRYMNGELSDEDVTEGEYISNWALAAERAATGGLSPKMTKEERDRRVVGLATDGAIPFKGEAFEEARRRMVEPLL
jgi:hypothetical protein